MPETIYQNGTMLPIEDGIMPMMQYEHYSIHEGGMFTASKYQAVLANGGTVGMCIVPATGYYPHIVYDAGASGAFSLRIIEGGTVASPTAITAYNRNRNSTVAAKSAITYGGTVTGGSAIFDRYVAGGNSQQTRVGGGSRAANEWILKAQPIVVELVNQSGGNIALSIDIEFYEKTDDD